MLLVGEDLLKVENVDLMVTRTNLNKGTTTTNVAYYH